jgi:sugar lactone lactonase YvrE
MRHIGFRFLIAFPAALALAVSVAVSAGPVVSAQAAPASLPVITTFTPGDFPESLAVDGRGNLYASLGFIGEVVKVAPGGQQQPVASLPVGAGLLTGLAFDPGGNLYVADATFEASPTPPGVFRIGADGVVTRVATLPADSFPNGLAFHGGSLYISDSSLGAIWRLPPGGNAAIWLQDPVLAPKVSAGIGANGLAFWRGSLYVAVADSGTIVRVPLTAGGNAGTPVVTAQAPLLRTADGIAFDVQGNLYTAVNNNQLVRLAPDGVLTELAAKNDGLVYPTMLAFGTTSATRTTLYITNGALRNGTPGIVAFDTGVRGLPLP